MLSGLSQIVVTLSAGLGLNDDGFAAPGSWGLWQRLHCMFSSRAWAGEEMVGSSFSSWQEPHSFGWVSRKMAGYSEPCERWQRLHSSWARSGMRLHHRAAMIVMAGIACLGDGCHHQSWDRPRRAACGNRCIARSQRAHAHAPPVHQDQLHPASGSPGRPARQFPTVDLDPNCPDRGRPRKRHRQKAGGRSPGCPHAPVPNQPQRQPKVGWGR